MSFFSSFRNQKIKKEKEILQQEVNKLRNEMKNFSEEDEFNDEIEVGIEKGRKKQTNSQTEIKILKQIIKTIEEKSTKEKNMLQKQLMKRKQEVEIYKGQITDLKITERNLRNELRTLTNELSIFRQRLKN